MMPDSKHVEESAAKVRSAAEREHAPDHKDQGRGGKADSGKADSESAAASYVLTDRKLSRGHPQTGRDK
jgi:hypothetical protein